MALSQSFTTSENSAGTIIYINDTTSDYSASNTGGYGSPNTERSDLALIAFLVHKKDSGDVVLSSESYDPESVTQFEFQGIDGDTNGWYQGTVYTFNRKTGGETPSEGDYVYDFTADELQRYDGASWVAIAAANWKTQIESDGETPTKTLNHKHISGYWKAINHLTKLIAIGCHCKTKEDLREYRISTQEQLNGFLALMCEGSRSQAQINAERYEDRISEILLIE